MVIIDLKVFNSNNFLDCCLLEITNTVLPNLQSQTQHFLFLSLRLLLDSIIHVYNAIWPYSLLKFKNFKSRLNRTWRSIRNECLLSWPKQTGELDTRISLPTEGQREKQNPRKDWKEKQEVSGKRCGSSPFNPLPAFYSWGGTAWCGFLSAHPYSLSLHWRDSCVLCTDSISPNYGLNKENKTKLYSRWASCALIQIARREIKRGHINPWETDKAREW